ncbi:MAG: succinyldiaminopimelate transaminase [Planctomycetota bacterium]
MNPILRASKPYPMAELQRRKAELAKTGVRIHDFGTGDPVEPTPPFILDALKQAVPTISQYPSVAGTTKLRSAAAGYMQRRFGVTLDPATQILPSSGSKEAIFHLGPAFLDPGTTKNTIVYGTPGYPVYESSAMFAGGVAHPVVLERARGFRLELERLPTALLNATAIAWLNYPHNPTGACVDLAYFAAQRDVAKAHGILLCSDECYQDLWFNDAEPPPSLLQTGIEDVLAFHSCSKRSGMTGYRSGFIAGDAKLIAEYRRWRVHFGVGSPEFIEHAAAAAWSDDQHAAQRRTIFAAKYAVLSAGLQARGLEILPSSAGLYLWAKAPKGVSADAYAAQCLDRGIVISPGGFFGPGGDQWFRLALVPSVEACKEALAVWP